MIEAQFRNLRKEVCEAIAGLRRFLPKRDCRNWPAALQGTGSPDFLSRIQALETTNELQSTRM